MSSSVKKITIVNLANEPLIGTTCLDTNISYLTTTSATPQWTNTGGNVTPTNSSIYDGESIYINDSVGNGNKFKSVNQNYNFSDYLPIKTATNLINGGSYAMTCSLLDTSGNLLGYYISTTNDIAIFQLKITFAESWNGDPPKTNGTEVQSVPALLSINYLLYGVDSFGNNVKVYTWNTDDLGRITSLQEINTNSELPYKPIQFTLASYVTSVNLNLTKYVYPKTQEQTSVPGSLLPSVDYLITAGCGLLGPYILKYQGGAIKDKSQKPDTVSETYEQTNYLTSTTTYNKFRLTQKYGLKGTIFDYVANPANPYAKDYQNNSLWNSLGGTTGSPDVLTFTFTNQPV